MFVEVETKVETRVVEKAAPWVDKRVVEKVAKMAAMTVEMKVVQMAVLMAELSVALKALWDPWKVETMVVLMDEMKE